jgi:hypothetical protein
MEIAKNWREVHLHAMKYNPSPSKRVKKSYALYEGNNFVLSGNYALLVYKRNEMIREGRREDLLKIKPITK